ncbi:Hot dog fold protein HP0420 [hydrothermal vent metagenome]|uniref:Hot dog fold protein HP0420 n=1 Tax=hydrothermal vent metagenome TaxID=652676 RepID=A0A1W1BE32_9ZZZZ
MDKNSNETKQENSKENQELDSFLSEKKKLPLQTHTLINNYLCGDIIKHEKGYVEVKLQTENEMVVDDMGLIHGGFIFGAADFAAMAAVNEKNVVLVASECQFLSPVKVGDKVLFKAQVRHQEGRKRNVLVKAYVLDIKVFEGEFMTIITDRHVLKLKLLDEESDNQ